MNRWNIPELLEEQIRKRDKRCVYCRIAFERYLPATRRRIKIATWEHIDNDVRNKTLDNVVLCCGACNSSKGAKKLLDWFASDYCKKRNINKRTVLPIVKNWLKDRESR